ncbi:MAG: hypothetical protein J6S71_03440 [Clostridia bacterium]|nr:hypothetical protein [Clostridia bacterium]
MTAASATASTLNISMILLIIGLPLLIALCIIEFLLGRSKNPFLGWILPILFFVIALIISLQGLTFEEPAGEIILWHLIPQIPTIILFLIFGAAHYSQKETRDARTPAQNEIKRMNIQDL